ncbi:intradiol ring-cleavage dioxygenase [Paracoccus sp. M683]|uniref:intradiol ring-cleavage dioxygenase n=1 Tax=Paracoccus sp. M683 TaxID=2594268 RepID=UPI00117C9FF0|nr:intradiol ring-cleavage dioxygenase [Paracoccus sp. M683]TRW96709.1 intradiol ring-cleavage dioxygenase [Paracoccus sp. M683]
MTNRRDLLKVLAAAAPATLGIGLWPGMLRAQAAAAGLISPNVCSLMPEVTEGPYYIDPELVRADIREDRVGVAMTMRLQIVDAGCAPIEGARVDIWHCDAQGNYSGFAGQGSDAVSDTAGQTFLRGTQMADAQGLVAFQTIYPGWYSGRTTHLHFKVFLDQTNLLTGQIFLPDALSQYIYDNAPDYGGRSSTRDTFNQGDGIAAQAGAGAYAHIAEQPDGYDAALVVGVARDAVSQAGQRPGGGPPPGGGPGNDGGRPPSPQGPADGTVDPASLIPGQGA